ncbi:MAG TPA: indole-3-glycerol phosphate synthase TrpC [Terriglobales bacterium]|nr:indole-3-glycerol phosphate synthase TrpC [Terriglobales bacterium]
MPVSLDQIVASTRRRVAETKSRMSVTELERQAATHEPRGFANALRAKSLKGPAVIAELKKASPSKGLIRGSFHVAALAAELTHGGAAALSVLTDEEYFQGSLDYLVEASAAVNIPLLRKDFIVDEFQIVEARVNCADAILLIVAALSDGELKRFNAKARETGLDVLCEVHDETELERALAIGFDVIGVNSRNLRTFHVDLNTALRLGPMIPDGVVRVAESGIESAHDIASLREAGYHAFLVGETLMRADHPGEALSELLARRSVAL